MKEDILEQLVEDWLVNEPGWFVKHNLKFRPNSNDPDYVSKLESVHSDVDILALSGVKKGPERVMVFTCKSWQEGFSPITWRKHLEADAFYHEPTQAFRAREGWKSIRELVSRKWMRAFIDQIEKETGQRDLIYYVAVTRLTGSLQNRQQFEESEIVRERFKQLGSKMELRIITLEEIIMKYLRRIEGKETPVLEATDVGRMLQLMRAAKIESLKLS